MKVAWVFAESLQLPPKYTNNQLHDIAPIWGSWKLWRSYHCDHCICGNLEESQYCIDHEYNQYCNLYIPDVIDKNLPNVVKFGSQGQADISNRNDIISLHLAGSRNDLILSLGFDQDADIEILKSISNNYPDKQWVIISIRSIKHNIIEDNITCDLLDNVLKSLS